MPGVLIRGAGVDNLRQGKLTLPWTGHAEHCNYTEEQFAVILDEMPAHKIPAEDVRCVLQEIVGYFKRALHSANTLVEDILSW